MYDVVALGELLIDFTPAGRSENENALFEENQGGAPANVVVALARWGKKTAFIGKVGHDQFGLFLRDVLRKANVDSDGLVLADDVPTTLAFVHLDESGNRSFSFYRQPGADMMLRPEEVRLDQIAETKVFHFGSVSMTHEPARSATLEAVESAHRSGAFVSFDPNLRPALWGNLDEAKRVILAALPHVDLLNISEEELVFLTDAPDLARGTACLSDRYDLPLLFVTLGPRGCFYRAGRHTGSIPTYEVRTIDTTGAGDAFLAGLLYKLTDLDRKPISLEADDLREMVELANAAGALTTTRRGAIPAIPSWSETVHGRDSLGKLDLE